MLSSISRDADYQAWLHLVMSATVGPIRLWTLHIDMVLQANNAGVVEGYFHLVHCPSSSHLLSDSRSIRVDLIERDDLTSQAPF